MATATLVSVEEYLASIWHPDRDYVDGELIERNMGELSHGRLQALMSAWLIRREVRWRMKTVAEVRLQIGSSRFRIPDVMVLSSDAPHEEIVKTPPLLCIEILSPEDRMSRIMERVRDYFQIGVPVCWIIDPALRSGWVATPGHLAEPADGILRAGEIEMPLAQVLEAQALEPPVA
jgi:Uma2 family endonuclease